MNKTDWLRCPRCGAKTRAMVREHTVLEDFPLFCPKCRYQCVVRFRDGKLEVAEPLETAKAERKAQRALNALANFRI